MSRRTPTIPPCPDDRGVVRVGLLQMHVWPGCIQVSQVHLRGMGRVLCGKVSERVALLHHTFWSDFGAICEQFENVDEITRIVLPHTNFFTMWTYYKNYRPSRREALHPPLD
jgi:hypothetical protein